MKNTFIYKKSKGFCVCVCVCGGGGGGGGGGRRDTPISADILGVWLKSRIFFGGGVGGWGGGGVLLIYRIFFVNTRCGAQSM